MLDSPAPISQVVAAAVTLTKGTRIGVYEIVELMGAGGMGEVYRARDTMLGRDVAIKMLPTMLANDPDRLARLSREARILASLSHPHIGAIYGVEEQHGLRALVLELIDGRHARGSSRTRLSTRREGALYRHRHRGRPRGCA